MKTYVHENKNTTSKRNLPHCCSKIMFVSIKIQQRLRETNTLCYIKLNPEYIHLNLCCVKVSIIFGVIHLLEF